MKAVDTEEFIKALEARGYEWRTYSGRGMYSTQCVGITLGSDGDLWSLAQALATYTGGTFPAPHTDSMGRGIIAYWPNAKIEQ
jgi:hypothetical protein